jgi:hypothetical protein
MLKGVSGLTVTMHYITLYSVNYSQLSAKSTKYTEHVIYRWTDTTSIQSIHFKRSLYQIRYINAKQFMQLMQCHHS